MNYREARDLLDGKGKKRGPRDSLKIARNTYLERGWAFRPPISNPPIMGSKYRTGYSFAKDTYCEVYAAMGFENDYPDNAIGLRLHGTYVAILTPHWTELYTGSWYTMTTADRMRYVANVGSDRSGWNVYLINDNLPCYWCKGTGIEQTYRPATGKYVDGPCSCSNGKRSGPDYDNGHPYFDGIRISADGKRLMREQPHKPKTYRPIKTQSGW